MGREICRLFRRASLLQVGGARAQDQANGPNPHCDRSAVRQFPYTHGEVDMLFYQVHVSIGEL